MDKDFQQHQSSWAIYPQINHHSRCSTTLKMGAMRLGAKWPHAPMCKFSASGPRALEGGDLSGSKRPRLLHAPSPPPLPVPLRAPTPLLKIAISRIEVRPNIPATAFLEQLRCSQLPLERSQLLQIQVLENSLELRFNLERNNEEKRDI